MDWIARERDWRRVSKSGGGFWIFEERRGGFEREVRREERKEAEESEGQEREKWMQRRQDKGSDLEEPGEETHRSREATVRRWRQMDALSSDKGASEGLEHSNSPSLFPFHFRPIVCGG